jgi:tetratricopeptide (TPR) repeat protein
MKSRHLAFAGAIVLLLGAAVGAAFWMRAGPAPESESPVADLGTDDLPIPPVPPRIAEGEQYDQCMTTLIDDPEAAESIASNWQAAGGGDAATHCQALAMIAAGDAEGGAKLLETMAHGGKAEGVTRVVLLNQAAEARLMADQADESLRDASEALTLSPEDPDLLMERANAYDALDRSKEAMDDLDDVLRLDETRGDAFVLRASIWRKMEMLDEARSDVEKALTLDPDDAEALLERGILRQRAGDPTGAREDWTRARDLDPNSDTAELADQNLTLLESGPKK